MSADGGDPELNGKIKLTEKSSILTSQGNGGFTTVLKAFFLSNLVVMN